jgi:5-formyltetrahydrofolate cyclo-ligase
MTGEAGGPAEELQAWKRRLRRDVTAAREELGDAGRARYSAEITGALLRWPGLSRLAAGSTVAVYVGVGTEPATDDLLEQLGQRDLQVLLPVWGGRAALDWARYTGKEGLQPAPAGLIEPTGPPLGASAIASADVVIVPALAVDRTGIRLGRGAGAYDAALSRLGPDCLTCALLFPGELLTQLPAEPHDRRVSAVALPDGVLAFADI